MPLDRQRIDDMRIKRTVRKLRCDSQIATEELVGGKGSSDRRRRIVSGTGGQVVFLQLAVQRGLINPQGLRGVSNITSREVKGVHDCLSLDFPQRQNRRRCWRVGSSSRKR